MKNQMLNIGMEIEVETWYNKYGPMVFRRCKSLLGNEDEALDAMQEVFVNLMRFKHRLSGQAPSSLLYTMASNHCLNSLKAKKRRGIQLSDEFAETLQAKNREIEAVDAQSLLEEIFAQHDDKTRLIAWLHFVDGHTLDETASQVGMSLSGIRKRIRKLQSSGGSLWREQV